MGRVIVQRPALQAIAAPRPLVGAVLNAGCGEGSYCRWIESFAGVTVIENIDVQVPDWFRSVHTDPRHRIRRGSLTALPYAAASFDAVVCTEVIEHIRDDRAAVAELARVLKPGGVLIASVPFRPAPFDPNHARMDYSLGEFTELLGGAGLSVEAHRLCCHALLRGVMQYWRRPWLRFGASRTPFIPRALMSLIAHVDRVLRIGQPWDIVVRATRDIR